MCVCVEDGTAGFAQPTFATGHRPAGEDAGEAGDVGLGIAAADAERVQFQDFTSEVFIEPALAVLARTRVRADRLLVIEKEQHRRMMFHRQQHVGEAAEHERADGFPLEGAGAGPNDIVLCHRDTEMVRPETDKPFDEAGLGPNGLVETRLCFRPEQRRLDRRHGGFVGSRGLRHSLGGHGLDRRDLGGHRLGARRRWLRCRGGHAVEFALEICRHAGLDGGRAAQQAGIGGIVKRDHGDVGLPQLRLEIAARVAGKHHAVAGSCAEPEAVEHDECRIWRQGVGGRDSQVSPPLLERHASGA